jgi:alkylated DNA nucleotide flippase Atl1
MQQTKTSWWRRVDSSTKQRKKLVEKKCEKNLEKSERVSVKRRYKMKTLNGHTKEPEPDERELLMSVSVLWQSENVAG